MKIPLLNGHRKGSQIRKKLTSKSWICQCTKMGFAEKENKWINNIGQFGWHVTDVVLHVHSFNSMSDFYVCLTNNLVSLACQIVMLTKHKSVADFRISERGHIWKSSISQTTRPFWVVILVCWLVRLLCWLVILLCWLVRLLYWLLRLLYWLVRLLYWLLRLLYWLCKFMTPTLLSGKKQIIIVNMKTEHVTGLLYIKISHNYLKSGWQIYTFMAVRRVRSPVGRYLSL